MEHWGNGTREWEAHCSVRYCFGYVLFWPVLSSYIQKWEPFAATVVQKLSVTVDTVCAVRWNGPWPENALISIIHLREVLPILRKSFLDMRRCMIFLLGHGPILAMLWWCQGCHMTCSCPILHSLHINDLLCKAIFVKDFLKPIIDPCACVVGKRFTCSMIVPMLPMPGIQWVGTLFLVLWIPLQLRGSLLW